MLMTKCVNGHFYDAERFDICPHCPKDSDEINATVGFKEPSVKIEKPPIEKPSTDDIKTVGFFNQILETEADPVVGWLVCVKGNHLGKDYRLKSGRNFVGRGEEMDVCLKGENSVSREKHATIIYEPKENKFFAQPGDSKELFYLNGNLVSAMEQIKAYDRIQLGDAELMFIPCCSDSFKWS